jgi:hypothetical protein
MAGINKIQVFIVIGLFLSSLFTFGLVQAVQRFGTCEKQKEPFANEPTQEEGSLESIVANVKRIGSYLIQPTMWTERIHMSSMSPMELARHYLQNSSGGTE